MGDIRQNIESVIDTAKAQGYREYIPEENIWKVMIHCLRGLHELHIRRIVHRDIKSANLFIYKDNLIKLGDFNVSMIKTEGKFYIQVIAILGYNKSQNGTPYYAAPEIWRGVSNDEK